MFRCCLFVVIILPTPKIVEPGNWENIETRNEINLRT